MRVGASCVAKAMCQVLRPHSSEGSPLQTDKTTASSPAFYWRLMGGLVRLWASTWRVRREPALLLECLLDEGPVVLGFWHENLAVLAPLHADRQFVGMVSRSRDGERLAQLLTRLGFHTVRGSTTTGARAVARAGLRALRGGRTVAIALDGPRGPRHHVSPGAPTLARWTDRPLVLVGCRAWPAVRLSSWDRQCLPLPFARITVTYAVCSAREPAAVGHHLTQLCLTGPSVPAP